MALRIQDKEIESARKMAGRKNGVTRKQLAERLKIKPERAKVVLDHAMTEGKWDKAPLGQGRDNRTLVFYKRDSTKSASSTPSPYKRKKKGAKKKVNKKSARRTKAKTKPRRKAKKG